MEASLLSQVILPLSLFIIMWGLGLSLTLQDFKRVLHQPKAAVIGIVCQMLMLPIVGFAIIQLFNLSGELAVGLMLLTFCPGGVTSNMYSYLARGDTALSISLTAVVSVLTPFTIPLLTLLMMQNFMSEAQQFDLPIGTTMMQLLVITVLPVGLGMAIHHKWPLFSAKAEKPIKIVSVVFLFLIIAGIIAKEWTNMASFFLQTGFATLCLNLATLGLGYYIALLLKLNKPQAKTIAIEVGIQNGTLALMIAGSILQSTLMTVPAITYSLIMFATGGGFCILINRNKPSL
ncbi:bile acid:sodium symporter [Saccharobesus litoralis]|uniref:Bile acid:sodium symporter n=1 Tax=Saccharobesus litoralis TaxID=2172099 RepID=A0A2S0VNE7_9ALTE|nr:bile acid:sodium symporter family protein [Saccharobesus litoralis]AWB65747.1 bile acid:sodium symporter [Saccharobesus litoralis]